MWVPETLRMVSDLVVRCLTRHDMIHPWCSR
jgi:hypothetical protein